MTRIKSFLLASSFLASFGVAQAQYQFAPLRLSNDIDSLSYAYGVLFGTQYSNFNDPDVVVPDETMNPDNFLHGFISAFRRDADVLKFTPDEAQAYLQAFQADMRERVEQKRQAEIAQNKEAGAAYMSQNFKKKGVKVTESGLQYQHLVVGKGAQPMPGGKVRVNYKGSLIDGTVFDQNNDIEFSVDNLIHGMTEGLLLMHEGGKTILTIPSDLGYGDRGAGQNILPGATLIFEIELLKVLNSESE